MMKKLWLILFTLSAGLLFAQNPQAVIREMSGTVELKKSGSADWAAAKEGDSIGKDTVISTGFKSMAVLAAGNSTIMVRPLTRLSLAELMSRNETETVNVSLSTGRIRVDVKPPAGSRADFTVQTPTATASVRGTSFEMNTMSIQVLEGSVNYTPVNAAVVRPVVVSAGQESWIDDSTGGAVQPMAAAETARTLPVLPGQNAVPVNANPPLDVSGKNGSLELGLKFESGN
jgi:hypothetical protein